MAIHVAIHTYIHTCIHTYIYMYIYIHTHIMTYIHTYIVTYIHTYIHTHTYHIVYIHTHIHPSSWPVYTHTMIYIYAHTHTYIHYCNIRIAICSARCNARRASKAVALWHAAASMRMHGRHGYCACTSRTGLSIAKYLEQSLPIYLLLASYTQTSLKLDTNN